ncbi:hypothetical protein BZG72_15965 [Salinivibrio sp. PR6]|uniref:AAA family ATPase n=1 Tax=Salinivibrio sp. PR6 TaxID=1909485 RepID=UPI0009892FD0|nr:ATP-binding protein [Salinivibrio sp. PR6]OOE77975.1 hypothetical protein BZG72_15965 [Salinivibrio sp. PR6]
MSKKHLKRIETIVPHTEKRVDIELNGKNLIIIGGNGCGKTRLLDLVYRRVFGHVVEKENKSLNELYRDLETVQNYINKEGPSGSLYDYRLSQKKEVKDKIREAKKSTVSIRSLDDFILSKKRNESVLVFFDSGRKSEIDKPVSIEPIEVLKEQKENLGAKAAFPRLNGEYFEKYLVSLKTEQALLAVDNGKDEEFNRINSWFLKLEEDLRDLFEDDGLRLLFDRKSRCFKLKQKGKDSFSFQSLSSGFSSIMAIYAELLTRVSLNSIEPECLKGLVFIDEIDAHLHVSLQKKILSFFTKSFPNVQFIVTTHSPFVVSSVDDALIYDLSRCESVEDLSMYSYEAVLEGLFGVSSASTELQDNIKELSNLLNESPIDVNKIQDLLRNIPEDRDVLDYESDYFVKSAELAIKKLKG